MNKYNKLIKERDEAKKLFSFKVPTTSTATSSTKRSASEVTAYGSALNKSKICKLIEPNIPLDEEQTQDSIQHASATRELLEEGGVLTDTTLSHILRLTKEIHHEVVQNKTDQAKKFSKSGKKRPVVECGDTVKDNVFNVQLRLRYFPQI